MINANQLTQSYTTALACPMTTTNNTGATLLTTASPTQLSTIQTHPSHTTTNTSPYIFLTASDDICASTTTTGTTADLTGKTTTLTSPSTLYFYNNNSTPTMYPTEFLRL